MTEEDFKHIETNLKKALEYEKTLNKQLLGRLDAYQEIIRMLLRLLIAEVKEGK